MSLPTLQEFREQVRANTDLVGLIGESIALQPRHGGRHYVGLCPFHPDNNPSLNVYPDRQTYRCWSCQAGGDCFTYLMEREKVTFPEALELLARRANLPLPKTLSRTTPSEDSNRARLFEVLQWAENEFHRALLTLPSAAPALEYLKGRGFTDATIQEYHLGFHPDDWTWLLKKAESKYSPDLLLEARLVGSRDGRHYDNFVNRILFPIHNERGQAVSFGGRILPGSTEKAKYWNGPESIVFHKSRLLYAIDVARDAIRLSRQAIVVEGYTDCITCHQHGIKNVVATLGTALTDSHVTALKRFAQEVVLVFDGDDAGQNAARKAVERFLAQDVELRILTLPEKLDPAEYLAAYNSESFQELAQRAPEAWEWQFRAVRATYGGDTVAARQRILEEMLQLLAQVPNLSGTLREGMLIANLALRLQVSEEVVRQHLQGVRDKGQEQPRRIEAPEFEKREVSHEVQRVFRGRLSSDERVECDLLEQVMAVPECVRYVFEADEQVPLRNAAFRKFLDYAMWEVEENGGLSLAGLLGRIEDPELKSLVVWIDEQAVAKGLAAMMTEGGCDEHGCPLFLKRSLEIASFRQSAREHSVIAAHLSQQATGAGRLDEATEDALLRQAAEFHSKRQSKSTTV